MEAISRANFAQSFLNVTQQLDALQHLHTPQQPLTQQTYAPPHSPASQLELLPRERIHRILLRNECFRPSTDGVVTATARSHHSLSPHGEPMVPSAKAALSPRNSSSSTDNAHNITIESLKHHYYHHSPLPTTPTPAVYVPVGGKARVLPSHELVRIKAALKKRSSALANFYPMQSSSNVGGSILTTELGKVLRAHNKVDGGALSIPQDKTTTTNGAGKQQLIAELIRRTKFSTENIFQLSRKFKTIAGATKSVICFDEFRQIMSENVGNFLTGMGIIFSNRSSDPDGEINDYPPQADMSAIGATISGSETFLRRLFLTFDTDGDGKIDFREFVVGFNGFVSGTAEEKVNALFDVYAQNDHPQTHEQPTVAISDLLGLFQGDRQLYHELMWCVDEYFVRVELRDDSTIKEDEFVATSLAEPHLLAMISRPVPSRKYTVAVDGHTARELIRQLIEQQQITWQKLLGLQRRMAECARSTAASGTSPTSPTWTAIPVADFHQILLACLGPLALADEELTQRILLAYVASPHEVIAPNAAATPISSRPSTVATPTSSRPTTSTGDALTGSLSSSASLQRDVLHRITAYVSCGEFTQDIAVTLQSMLAAEQDPEAKARYYFEIYDADGDGVLSRGELCAAVCASFAHFGQNVMQVVRVLEDEDRDGDGQLTRDEYLRAAQRSPLILASLYTCLPREN